MGDADARPRDSKPRASKSRATKPGAGKPRASRPHARPQRRTSSTAIVLVTTKLRPPVLRPGTVGRPRLTDLLPARHLRPVVSVVAPPGFGKTTLLAQWAEQRRREFAWVSVEEPDNDPKVLLSYIAEALNMVAPIGDGGVRARSPRREAPCQGRSMPRLVAAFSAMPSPVVLVLDDVHVLHNRECQAALSALADHVPPGSHLVLAGRAQPPLRLARLRAEARLTEIGHADLVLSAAEAGSLLHAAGVALGEHEAAELHRHTEGWPAALYLAALHLREGGSLPRAAATFGGANRLVSDYLEAELLSRVSPSAAAVPDQDGGAGAAVGIAVRGGARSPRQRCHAGRTFPVEPAARPARRPGRLVPLPPPVPRHAAGGPAPHRTGTGPGTAAQGRALVRA